MTEKLQTPQSEKVGDTEPVASFTYTPLNPDTNEEVQFDASGSYDPDGSIQSYEWDFNSDGKGIVTTTSPTVNHPYSNSKGYTARLSITGLADPSSVSVTLKPEPPHLTRL